MTARLHVQFVACIAVHLYLCVSSSSSSSSTGYIIIELYTPDREQIELQMSVVRELTVLPKNHASLPPINFCHHSIHHLRQRKPADEVLILYTSRNRRKM
jgi:hypothetical protein